METLDLFKNWTPEMIASLKPHIGGSYERTPEVREKQSKANSEAWRNPSIRDRYLKAFSQKLPNPNALRAMHEALRKKREDPKWVEEVSKKLRGPRTHYIITNPEENYRVHSEALTGRIFTDEHRRNLSEAARFRKPPSEELKKHLSEVQKKNWADPKFARRMAASQNRKPNWDEILLGISLEKNFPGEWAYVGDGKVWIEGRNPDFININGKKLVIELFGYYWHLERARTDDDEADRINHYSKYGFGCLVLWAYDLVDEVILVDKIRRWME